MKRYLIAAFSLGYNRQGSDLAELLRSHEADVALLQLETKTDPKRQIFGVRWNKPTGRFHKVTTLLNAFRFFRALFSHRCDTLICIGDQSLVPCALYKLVFRVELIYYCLEYSANRSALKKAVIGKCLDKFIDVEENRLALATREYGIAVPTCVVYNMPHLTDNVRGGALRQHLKERFGIVDSAKLVVYAGSFQRYAMLKEIVVASRQFPDSTYLVLMAIGLPDELKSLSPKCLVIDPVGGPAFYDWLADVDCSLLPYETENDPNVQFCSPQKIFDCFAVGVPFLASRRPIIEKVLSYENDAGRFCDFTQVEDIVRGVKDVLALNRSAASRMKELHMTTLNYDCKAKEILSFVEGS